MTDKMREEFEAAFVRRQVDSQGEGFRSSAIYMLKRDGDFEKPPSHYEIQRREQGLYDAYWVEMVWWAWQASSEALVVELPEPEMPESYGVTRQDNPEEYEALEKRMGAQHSAIRKCRRAIEAADVKVKP